MTIHIPVLLHEIIDGLQTHSGGVYVDATLGGGGYTEALCEAIGAEGKVIAFDQDKSAIERAKKRLEKASCQIAFVEANFRELDTKLRERGVEEIDGIVFDLGLSSDQLEQSGRGFTFLKDEPLTMTFSDENAQEKITASMIVNEWQEESIADVIYGYGEERYARRIAKAIVEERGKQAITTTTELVSIIKGAVPSKYRNGKTHPATKTFQALRIAVNDELGALKDGLLHAYTHVRKGGRIVVVSFHSLEDRIVKRFFREKAKEGSTIITKKPITPSNEEITNNTRARSAKLRILEK